MINRIIACVSIFVSISSFSGLMGTTSAAIAVSGQPTVYGAAQQLTIYSSAQEESAPREGLPGRRVSGGTRNREVYKVYES